MEGQYGISGSMRKLQNILVLLITTHVAFAQNSLLVKGNRYDGAIFTAKYELPYQTNPLSERRFIPTVEEVAKLEEQLRHEIKAINKDKPNQGKNYGPIIHRNLNDYVRQYIGFVTPEGERVVMINFLWNKLSLIERIKGYSLWTNGYEDDWITVFDGGSRYWQIKYNLRTSEFFDFYVNGVA
ncbi:MAG: hypothetical protein AAF223_11340 [Bacteroidota bacterium]